MTPTAPLTLEAAPEIAAIREALDAGATNAWLTHPRDSNQWRANEMLALACSSENLRSVLATIAQLEARLREAEADAGRFQWLLDNANLEHDPSEPYQLVIWEPDAGGDNWKEVVRSMIDAAIAAHGKDGAHG